MLIQQRKFVKYAPPSLSQVGYLRCNFAAVGVETVETMDCVECKIPIWLTTRTVSYCVEGVENKPINLRSIDQFHCGQISAL